MSTQLNDQLIDLYECRVCGQYIVPPVFQCPEDHLFCSECLLSSFDPRVCPVCGLTLIEGNNRCNSLEDLAEVMELHFACKFSECNARLALNQLQEHQSVCYFRKVTTDSIVNNHIDVSSAQKSTNNLLRLLTKQKISMAIPPHLRIYQYVDDMEEYIFERAQTKEQYMSCVDNLIKSIKYK